MTTSTCDADRQGLPHGLQQQGKWAGPGAVGNHEADSLVFQARTGHRGSEELSDLLRLKDLARPTKNRSIGLGGNPLSRRRHSVTVPLGCGATQVLLIANQPQAEVWTARICALPSMEVAMTQMDQERIRELSDEATVRLLNKPGTVSSRKSGWMMISTLRSRVSVSTTTWATTCSTI
jgi:hypothetical protein